MAQELCLDLMIKSLRVWDAVTGGLLITFEGHTDAVKSVAWSQNGTKIVTGSNDETG